MAEHTLFPTQSEALDLGIDTASEGSDSPTCAGNDGDCSRDVDEPGDYCWQHHSGDE